MKQHTSTTPDITVQGQGGCTTTHIRHHAHPPTHPPSPVQVTTPTLQQARFTLIHTLQVHNL
jgi:hypothetical protein